MSSSGSDLDATYDAWSESYDDDQNIMLEAEASAVGSILCQLTYCHVLDAAAGTGRYAIQLAQKGAKVCAFDANEQMLEVARKKAVDLDIELALGSLPAIPWAGARFDLVICAMALAHVEEFEASVANLAAAVEPGGNLLVSDLHPSLQAEAGPTYHEFIAGEMRAFPQFRCDISDYLDAFKAAELELISVLEVPVELPGRGTVPGVSVFHCAKESAAT
jgi:ubiquinone/menaquinone biosynthesis C-methylase UbiE